MRYFLTFAATLGLLFLVLFLLFHHTSGPKPQTRQPIASYATTNAQTRLTIDGPVNADQNHVSVRITVDNTSVTFQQFQGYQGRVVNQQTFASNENAYVNFLLALVHAGFTQGNTNPALKDERGYCPLGNRYIFEFMHDGNDIERYWATTCSSPKTYLGNLEVTLDLFKAQVPNYSNLTDNLGL